MSSESPSYWYKVTVTTMHHNPASFEGGLWAKTVKGAADSLETLSKTWNVLTINTISIFKMEDGVIADEPELFSNELLKRSSPINPNYQERVRVAAIESLDVHKQYNDAEWCKELNVPLSFTTVSIKEKQT